MHNLEIETLPVESLVPYVNNAKLHPYWQVEQIADSIKEFGNCDPIAVWTNTEGEREIVEGHGRLMALQLLGIDEAPVIFLNHLTDEQRKAYALVHNKLTIDTDFDMAILDSEIQTITDVDMSRYDFTIDKPLDLDQFDTDTRNPEKEEVEEAVEPVKGTIVCECCGELIYL